MPHRSRGPHPRLRPRHLPARPRGPRGDPDRADRGHRALHPDRGLIPSEDLQADSRFGWRGFAPCSGIGPVSGHGLLVSAVGPSERDEGPIVFRTPRATEHTRAGIRDTPASPLGRTGAGASVRRQRLGVPVGPPQDDPRLAIVCGGCSTICRSWRSPAPPSPTTASTARPVVGATSLARGLRAALPCALPGRSGRRLAATQGTRRTCFSDVSLMRHPCYSRGA